jgi:hypothetical protein
MGTFGAQIKGFVEAGEGERQFLRMHTNVDKELVQTIEVCNVKDKRRSL